MRIETQKTRQALLVVGSAMEESPPPEKLELFTEDGQPVDVGKDRTRARWRGTWVSTPEAPYEQNDFVMHEEKLYILADSSLITDPTIPPSAALDAWAIMTISGGMNWAGEWDSEAEYKENSVVSYAGSVWIAPDDIEANTEPGYVIPVTPPASLFTNRGVIITEADRFNSVSPVLFTIDAETGRDNDITGGLGAVIYLDKTGSLDSGTTLTITPVSRADDSADFSASTYLVGGTYRPLASGSENDAAVDSGTPLVLDIDDDGSDDLVVHIFYNAGTYGTFTAQLNHNTNLVAPPVIEAPPVEWERVVPPTGGFKGDWVEDDVYPAGSIVKYIDGKTYGTNSQIQSMAPDDVAGSVVGTYLGVEATTLDRLATGIARTFTIGPLSQEDTGGSRSQPLVIEFVSSLADLTLHVVNGTDDALSWIVEGSGGAVPGLDNIDEGETDDVSFPAASYMGGDGQYVLAMRFGAATEGEVQITATGGVLVAPDVPNPWRDLGGGDAPEGLLPAGGDVDYILAKASADDYDVVWVEAPTGGGGGGDAAYVPTEDWHIVGAGGEPAFQNSWGAGSPAVTKFRKRPDGTVEIRGFAVKGSPSGRSVIFTLPVGYRIESAEDVMRFPVSGSSTGYVEVFTNGDVKCDEMGYVSLDPVEFSMNQADFPAGGAPPTLFLYDAAQYNTSSGSYTYAGTEEIVIPSDGDYEINFSASLGMDNASSGNRTEAGPAVNGSVDGGLVAIRPAISGDAYAVSSYSVGGRVLTLTEGDVIRPMFKRVTGGLAYIEQIKISVRPVTVG